MDSLIKFLHTEKPLLDKPPASPFLKWAGGKRQMIPEISKYMPSKIDTYWEPFIGGGAVFFTFADRINRAILSDINEELVLAYHVVKTNPNELIDLLKKHQDNHSKEYYYKIRREEPDTAVKITARLIYLNKTCFNGLYRVNKSGKFNVPAGRYKNPTICNSEVILSASRALEKATIMVGSFEKIVKPKSSDFIYCDPPYDGCFTDYQAGGFGDEEQKMLQITAGKWADRGANIMISNSDTILINSLYSTYNIHVASASRNINSDANGRAKINELVITSYD